VVNNIVEKCLLQIPYVVHSFSHHGIDYMKLTNAFALETVLTFQVTLLQFDSKNMLYSTLLSVLSEESVVLINRHKKSDCNVQYTWVPALPEKLMQKQADYCTTN